MTVVTGITSSSHPTKPKNRKNEKFFRCLVSEYTNFDVVVYLKTTDHTTTEITVHEYKNEAETKDLQSLKIYQTSEFLHRCLATQYRHKDSIKKPAFTAIWKAALQKFVC